MSPAGRRWPLSALAMMLAVVAAAGMIVISETAYYRAESQLSRVVDMGRARLNILHVLRRVTEAESSKRGYILAGGPEYLIPYGRARDDVMATLNRLDQHFNASDDPRGKALMKRLRNVVEGKFGEMEEVKRLHDKGETARALEVIRSGIGRDLMDQLRNESDALVGYQNQRISEGLRGVYDTLQLNRIGVAAMTALSLLLLTLFVRQSRALAREQEARQAEVRAERDRLESEVTRRTADLTELARHLQTAREDERSRLARDLHDELGALLTAAKLDVARIRPKLVQVAPDLADRMVHLTEALNGGIALKRRIIEDLRPSTLNSLGLKAALEILCSEFAERSGVQVNTELEAAGLPAGLDITVFRMVQEALTNIGKYAQAATAWVTMKPVDGSLLVSVRDDGVGFDPGQLARGRHGLLGMRFRVHAARGELQIVSAPGVGTTLAARLPLDGAEPPRAA